jgi:hypothetical protein
MPGRSGATVKVTGEVAHKSATDPAAQSRLFAQMQWLRLHKASWVVRVHEPTLNGYTMERLYSWEPPPGAFNKVAHKVWSQPAEVDLDLSAHCKYVYDKVTSELPQKGWGFRQEVMEKMQYVMHHDERLTRCLTHGDLTRSNVMRTHDNWPVVIDPIPATPAVADIKAFDVSTAVISLLGLEHVQFGWPEPTSLDMLHLSGMLWEMNHVELECVRYMSVVQIARRLPYHPEEMHDDLIEIARQALRIRP